MSEASIALSAVNHALDTTVKVEPVGTKGLVAPVNSDAWVMARALHTAKGVLEKIVEAEEAPDRIMSEGVQYQIQDLLAGGVVISYDSWSHPDPGERAWELFEAYPRDAILYKTKIVKYERREIVRNYVRQEELDAIDATSPEN